MLDWIAERFKSEDYTIFISHSFEDATWLDDYLTGVVSNLGAKHLMAEHDFSLSTEGSISDKIANMIDTSDAVLAVLSPAGQASKFVQQEIGYAIKAKKPVIALIEACEGRVEKPGFLYDKDVVIYKDIAELKNLREYLMKIIERAWDKKRKSIKSNIILGGIALGGFLLSRFLPEDKEDYL